MEQLGFASSNGPLVGLGTAHRDSWALTYVSSVYPSPGFSVVLAELHYSRVAKLQCGHPLRHVRLSPTRIDAAGRWREPQMLLNRVKMRSTRWVGGLNAILVPQSI